MEKLTMTINKNELDRILQDMRIAVLTKEQYENILNMFDSEPDAIHEWTGQDIYEHIRKMAQNLI